MIRFSKNNKLNNALTGIYNQLKDFDTDGNGKSTGAVIQYYKDFKREKDYNIAQYGNLLVYYYQIYEFYKNCGYKSTANFSTSKIWDIYCRQVGYIVRNYFIK